MTSGGRAMKKQDLDIVSLFKAEKCLKAQQKQLRDTRNPQIGEAIILVDQEQI